MINRLYRLALAHSSSLLSIGARGLIVVAGFVIAYMIGSRLGAEALGTCFWATPAMGGGKVYLLDASGEVVVLKDGRSPEVLAQNAMPGEGRGSPVLHGGELLVRTSAGVFCVGGE